MATALADPEELRIFLTIDEEDFDTTRAQFILDGVSEEIRTFADQVFSTVNDDVVTLDGSGTSILLLPSVPVINVTSITEDGSALDPSAYEWSSKGILRRIDGFCWRQRFRLYTVTYDHGRPEIPESVALLAVRVAARAFANPTGLSMENEGGYGATYGYDSSRFPTLTDTDKDQLRDYMAK